MDSPTPAPAALEISSFSQLNSGNYWVYQRQQVDSTYAVIGNSIELDSIFVTGDTVINGNTYAVIHRTTNGIPSEQVQYWRDSANFILTSLHQVLFCSSPFDQVVYTTNSDVLHVDYSVASALVPVSVPAGNFDSYLMEGVATGIGNTPAIPAWKYSRTYWAADVGRVRWYQFYVFSPSGYRSDLIRYHV